MKSLHKVLDIIEVVSKVGSAGTRQLSSLTGFPPPTIHRIISTLVERHYLKQDPVTKKLSLSIRFLELGTAVQLQFNLATVARPHLEKLMEEARESVNLAIRDGDHAVYLEHVRSEYSMLQLFTKPGARVHLYCTGVGKMFLSLWSEEEVRAYLSRIEIRAKTAHTLVKPEHIVENLSKVRAQGFAVDDQETEMGVRCVAALALNHKGEPEAAVSISGAAMRITPERIPFYARMVKDCALEISRELGFRPGEQAISTS
ncbi:MAG: IclR family transcriptional regulator [Deltaproteobacteria bacterium]|nr:IclR family transcriptional regulator [Deltaproteobacteria bacterium]